MELDVELVGLPELVDRLAHAQAGLLDLTDVNQELASQLVNATPPPVRTGRLRDSPVLDVTGSSWGVTWTAPYAAYVNPWASTVLATDPTGTVDALAVHVQHLLD